LGASARVPCKKLGFPESRSSLGGSFLRIDNRQEGEGKSVEGKKNNGRVPGTMLFFLEEIHSIFSGQEEFR